MTDCGGFGVPLVCVVICLQADCHESCKKFVIERSVVYVKRHLDSKEKKWTAVVVNYGDLVTCVLRLKPVNKHHYDFKYDFCLEFVILND